MNWYKYNNMRASELIDEIQSIMAKYGDIDCVKPHREDGWLYPEFEPITNVDADQEVKCHESVGPFYLVID